MTATELAEVTELHSRLLRCSLCVEESRAYWAHVDPADPRQSARHAFVQSWFGAKSEAWTTELLANMRVRFDAYPPSLRALAGWRSIPPEARRVVCHFHVQLTDPLYRAFTGRFLAERRADGRLDLHRQKVIDWTVEHGPPRWAVKTQLQFATRLLSCSAAAGLVRGTRDPRALTLPRVSDLALEHILYTLRALRFDGTLVDNPYLASLGLTGGQLAERVRNLPAVGLRRLGDVHELEWRYPDLDAWALHTIASDVAPPPAAIRAEARP